MSVITSSEFSHRFASLVLSSRELPRKPRALNILLMSSVLGLEPERSYSEREINEELQKWILAFGIALGLDFVTLRRLLVDGGFISRDPAGVAYQLEATGRRFQFDPAIRDLDLAGLIARERESRERRKQAYAEGAKGK